MITRKEYMDTPRTSEEQAAVAHRAYWSQFVDGRTVSYVVRTIGALTLLRATDPHLNDIPLRRWDAMVHTLPVARSMKEAGDYYTLGACVCIAKEAARQYIESVQTLENALLAVAGDEWRALTQGRAETLLDFAEAVHDEDLDVNEYLRRIGRGNVQAYADTQVARRKREGSEPYPKRGNYR